jgi:hypothetical protein
MTYVEFGCRCVLGVVFAVSALSKTWKKGAFAAFRLATAALVPSARRYASALSTVVVVAEAAIVVALVVLGTAGLVAACLLLTAFTVAIAAAVRRGDAASCRCFGATATPVSARHLVRNALLIAVAALGLAMPGQAGGDPAALGLAAVAGVVVAVLVISFDAVADLFLDNHEGVPS